MTESILLLEKARQNLQAAELLVKNDFPEIAAARVYYAMFYTAEALLEYKGLTFSSHAAVIAAYGKEFARSGVLDPRYHRYLLDAQDLRQVSDYGVETKIPGERVLAVLGWARDFLSAADSWLKAQP